MIVFCNAHNKKLFKGFVKLAEENRIRLPSRMVDPLCSLPEIKACIQETEYRSTKFSVKELRNLGLFSERSAENWKRFNSSPVCSQSVKRGIPLPVRFLEPIMLCAAQRLSTRPLSLSAIRCFASSNNVIFVLGAPGSGKGKHSDHLVQKFGGCHVSVGEILREVVDTGCLTW